MTEVKAKRQSASLDRRKLLADPIMVTTIVVLIAFLTLFILYPLAILLVDSFYSENGLTLDIFKRVLAMANFPHIHRQYPEGRLPCGHSFHAAGSAVCLRGRAT